MGRRRGRDFNYPKGGFRNRYGYDYSYRGSDGYRSHEENRGGNYQYGAVGEHSRRVDPTAVDLPFHEPSENMTTVYDRTDKEGITPSDIPFDGSKQPSVTDVFESDPKDGGGDRYPSAADFENSRSSFEVAISMDDDAVGVEVVSAMNPSHTIATIEEQTHTSSQDAGSEGQCEMRLIHGSRTVSLSSETSAKTNEVQYRENILLDDVGENRESGRQNPFIQRSATSLSVRSEIGGVKPSKSKVTLSGTQLGKSCFELHFGIGDGSPGALGAEDIAVSQEIPRWAVRDSSRARTLSVPSRQFISMPKKSSLLRKSERDLRRINDMSEVEKTFVWVSKGNSRSGAHHEMGELSSNTDAKRSVSVSRENFHAGSHYELSEIGSLEMDAKKSVSISTGSLHSGVNKDFDFGERMVAERGERPSVEEGCDCNAANECLNTAFYDEVDYESEKLEEGLLLRPYSGNTDKQAYMSSTAETLGRASLDRKKTGDAGHGGSCGCLAGSGSTVYSAHIEKPRWRSASLSASYVPREISPITGDLEKEILISEANGAENSVRSSSKCSQYSQVSFASIPLLCESYDTFGDDCRTELLRPASEHQKTPFRKLREHLSVDERSQSVSRTHSSCSIENLSDSAPLGDAIPSTVNMRTPTPGNSQIPAEEGTPLVFMMRPDADHTPSSDFNQTRISREEYIKRIADTEQKAKGFSKSVPNSCTFITQHTVAYPINHLEMQRYPNGVFHYKYEGDGGVKCFTTQAETPRRDHSQTKERIITQSPEETSRAVSVLNVMLQRRLNNSGSQNGSFAQERGGSFYSTPPTGPPKSPQLVGLQSNTEQNRPHDFTDCDSPVSRPKNLSVEFEAEKQGGCVTKRHHENNEPKENLLKRYCYEKSDEKASGKSSLDGRSTIRDRLPRGQTRKLASLFETMNDAASAEMLREMDHLKRRGKSVPPGVMNQAHQRQPGVNIRKLSRDDTNVRFGSEVTKNTGGIGFNFGFTVPYRSAESGEQVEEDGQMVVEASSVRSIVNRFESASTPLKYENLARNLPIDSTPRRPVKLKRYSQYDIGAVEPIPDVTRHKSSQNVQSMAEPKPGRIIYGIPKSASLQSDEVSERAVRGSANRVASCIPHHENAGYTSSWDQQQYELGLRKGITDLKRYDSSYNRAQKETHQMDYRFELPENYHTDEITGRSQAANYDEGTGSEVVDQVAEVEKAFDFVNRTESLTTVGPRCSEESLVKPSQSVKAGYSISHYRNLERDSFHAALPDVPIRFSPAAYSPPPSAGERVETYGQNYAGVSSKGQCNSRTNQVVTTGPVATSTPVEGSPATPSRMQTSTSHILNRSGISSITASTGHELTQSQQLDMKLQAVKEGIMVQEDQIAQAMLALVHCKKSSSFNGTLVELSAQRGLLLARERLMALQNEMERLKTLRLVKKPMPPLAKRMRGAIDLIAINLYLNRNFCVRNTDENISYAFVILLKTDEQVEATQTVTLMDTRALRVSKIHFADQIRFTNLPVDFTVLLEIYALKVSECRRDDYSCSMLKNKAMSLLSPSKKTGVNESIVSSSEFTCCGHICLNRDTVGMQKFYLDGAVYPLEGTIEIVSRCTTLPPVIEIDFRGFLTMYQVVAGLGSWARYWAVLRRGAVHFWKYPDDEASEKPALACMDLSKCTDKKIGHASHELCSRPNAFTVDLLVPTSPTVIEKKRVLLSADTKELCNAWLNALNETLEVLRG